jgi:hypothetical protein
VQLQELANELPPGSIQEVEDDLRMAIKVIMDDYHVICRVSHVCLPGYCERTGSASPEAAETRTRYGRPLRSFRGYISRVVVLPEMQCVSVVSFGALAQFCLTVV